MSQNVQIWCWSDIKLRFSLDSTKTKYWKIFRWELSQFDESHQTPILLSLSLPLILSLSLYLSCASVQLKTINDNYSNEIRSWCRCGCGIWTANNVCLFRHEICLPHWSRVRCDGMELPKNSPSDEFWRSEIFNDLPSSTNVQFVNGG